MREGRVPNVSGTMFSLGESHRWEGTVEGRRRKEGGEKMGKMNEGLVHR